MLAPMLARLARRPQVAATPHAAPGPAAIRPFLLAAATAFIVDFTTDTPTLGPFYWKLGLARWLPGATQTTSATAAAALLVVAALWLVRPPVARERTQRSLQITAVLLGGAAAALTMAWSLPTMAAKFAGWTARANNALAWGLALGLLALALVDRRGRVTLGVLVATGLLVRWVHVRVYPITVGADMLPLTNAALRNFFAGRSPYTEYALPGPLPLTYYPLTWLAFAPARLLRLDLRITNILSELAIGAAVLWSAAGSLRLPKRVPPALLLWGAVFVLPSSVYFDRITTAPVAWALIAWTLGLAARRHRTTWVLLGLLIAATPLAAVLLPLIAADWLLRTDVPTGRARFRQAAGRLLGAFALAALFIVPFVCWAPSAYVEGTVLWFNDLDRFPGTKWRLYRTWQRYVGFAGLFWAAHAERWLKPLQAFGVTAITALHALRVRAGRVGAQGLPAAAAAAYLAFMTCNPVHWPYFYQPALIAGLIAAALPYDEGGRGDGPATA